MHKAKKKGYFMIKILIVEDQKIVRESLVEVFNADEDFTVVSQTGDAQEAPALCRQVKPDVVLMDICTENNSSGLDAAKFIKETYSDIKVVLMTGMPEVTFIERARNAGVDSFLYKNISLSEMIMLVKGTLSGYSTYPNDNKNEFSKNIHDLTDREMDILMLICEGKTRKEIAEELNLSESSIKSYTSTLLSKTGFTSTSKLAIYAISKGYINPTI